MERPTSSGCMGSIYDTARRIRDFAKSKRRVEQLRSIFFCYPGGHDDIQFFTIHDPIESWRTHTNSMNIEKYTICEHDISLASNPQVWSPHSAREMLWFLVEAGYLKDLAGLKVLDMGTGSGIVGILCGLRGAKEVTLADYSHVAVEQARENARLNGVEASALQSDRFAGLGQDKGQDKDWNKDDAKYDLIISNPPVQPWLHTDIAHQEERSDAADWNESGADGRLVLDALIGESHDHLSNNGALITSCSTRHGHGKTIALLNRHWKDDWKIIHESEHAIDENYHGPYLPAWQAMQAADNDLRVYQIDARQRRFARQVAPDGSEFIITTLKVADKEIPVRFTRTDRGWRITDTHGETIREIPLDHPDIPGPALTEHWYYTYYLIKARRRREKDALGELSIPSDVYYGIHAERGRRNFAVSRDTIGDWPNYLRCLAMLKKAAALTNAEIGAIEPSIADAICAAADEVINGRIAPRHFPVCVLQGGGGVSTHMNINEVLANRANEILTGRKGYDRVHPFDHVNRNQSTNDVVISGFRLAMHRELMDLIVALRILEDVLEEKTATYKDTVKLSRTCLQDAVPITLGQEFSAYLAPIRRGIRLLDKYAIQCLELPLGATAVGTGLGTSAGYRELISPHLADVSGLGVLKSSNFFDSLQNGDLFIQISGALKSIATSMSKMATDLRILSSGAAELRLPAVQAGSSFMPGKVNPAIPELMNQIAYVVCGNDVAVTMAVEGGELNLNVWYSVIAKGLVESCQLLANAAPIFARRCIAGIEVDEALCRERAERTLAISSVIANLFGYEQGVEVSRFAQERKLSVGRAAVKLGLLSGSEADELFDPMTLTDADRSAEAIRRFMARGKE
uniref:Aspartate ammonia-lyase n=1 Tax=Candidatus Kentrum sp. SD TaxID=2126332 RepID=A0A450YI00_9GAMM|nr:MAG: Aspartate ammonia-lyase [Candidatus Kentron sp. SD]VFK41141.1 MAG: Aspartate ammonia-lyase [Candidatus Kentron sp. SD]